MAGPVRHQFHAVHFAPDEIEAAARLGLDWAEAVTHRCRALLEPDGERAHEHFRAAVRLHANSGRPWESARTALLYGERLRPKTVSHHLYRAFPKLNVTSRAQFAGLQPFSPTAREP